TPYHHFLSLHDALPILHGIPLEDVTADQRNDAKAVNFGIVYGISDFGLAKNLGISRDKAHSYIENYFNRYPGIKEYMDRTVEERSEEHTSELQSRFDLV